MKTLEAVRAIIETHAKQCPKELRDSLLAIDETMPATEQLSQLIEIRRYENEISAYKPETVKEAIVAAAKAFSVEISTGINSVDDINDDEPVAPVDVTPAAATAPATPAVQAVTQETVPQ